jgi:hypothetical protein
VKRIELTRAIVAVLLLGTARVRCGEPAALPDTPAGQQTRRLLEALGTGQAGRIRAFIEANFAARFLEDIPLDQHVDLNS